MNQGGLSVNQRTAQIIRFAGLLIPILLGFYGILVQLGVASTSNYHGSIILYAIMVPWLALSIYQFLSPQPSRRVVAFILISYHVFSALYVLFVAGLSTPFTYTWMVLLLASYAYFSRNGLRISVLSLLAVAVGDTLLHLGASGHIITNILVMIATLTVGIFALSIAQAQEIDRDELTRSHAEENLQRDRMFTIVNNLADAILSTDKNGIIKIYNAASLGLLDTNAGLEGKSIDSIIKLVDGNDKPFKFVPKFKAAHSVESRDDLRTTISGERYNLSVIYSPIRNTDSHGDDSSNGYIVILRDITAQKSLEEERDEFISVVSHELRTPITVTEGALSNLQLMMDRTDIPAATLRENVKTSHDQIVYLARMVNDLSTLSRAERGVADTPELINVQEMIHTLYNEYAPQAETKGLHFNLDLSPQLGSVLASRLYLEELLQNFITNAIKYTKEGEITLSVHKTENAVRFSVKDSGIGISKSDQARIFEKFYRSEDFRTRETGGTGLGLYVATKLAKKLHVMIEMSSRLNHGSKFGFTMPSADTSADSGKK